MADDRRNTIAIANFSLHYLTEDIDFEIVNSTIITSNRTASTPLDTTADIHSSTGFGIVIPEQHNTVSYIVPVHKFIAPDTTILES